MTHIQLRKHCKKYSLEEIKWKTISFQNTLHFQVIQGHTHAHTHTNTAKFKNTGKHKLQNSDIEKLLAVKVDNQLDFQAPLNAVSKNN